jgi:hypothetical protein
MTYNNIIYRIDRAYNGLPAYIGMGKSASTE